MISTTKGHTLTEQQNDDPRPPIPVGDLLNVVTDHSENARMEAGGYGSAGFESATGLLALSFTPDDVDEPAPYRATTYYFALTQAPIVREG